jgi:epoxyqueuosine reductase QueG
MKKYITDLVTDYVKGYKLPDDSKTEWRQPLVGFGSAGDPLFPKLKDIVGKEHLMPGDVLKNAETVISYFIPFSKKLAYTNKDGLNCSREWAEAYVETNKMMSDLNNYLVNKIRESNHDAGIVDWYFDRERLLSTWSQRHVAFIAGLGTFGINNMLITEMGCCGRYGSIITALKLEPDKRPDSEFCLYKDNGSCSVCVKNCVFGALKEGHFDRNKCFEICRGNSALYRELDEAEACGKCLTVVPCSFTDPVHRKVQQ